MTYIAAFKCDKGIVMCADTLETVGAYKQYVEKIEIIDGSAYIQHELGAEQKYPIAVAGAGIADVVDAFAQELLENVANHKPPNHVELARLIKQSIATVYEKDLPVIVTKGQRRTPEFLIAAYPEYGGPYIGFLRGRRLKPVLKKAIIGYGNAQNYALLTRLYRDDIPMAQAVILATYLVSQSKLTDEGVGGESRVALIVEEGACFDNTSYVRALESQTPEFLSLTDELFLRCADASLSVDDLENQVLPTFARAIIDAHRRHIDNVLASFSSIEELIKTNRSPYKKLPSAPITMHGTPPYLRIEHDAEKVRKNIDDFKRVVAESKERWDKLHDAVAKDPRRWKEMLTPSDLQTLKDQP
jgi:hypothetical protein